MVVTLFELFEDMMKTIEAEKAHQFAVVQTDGKGWVYSRPEKFAKIMKVVK